MTTVTRETIEERWRVVQREVRRFAGERGLSSTSSARWDRVNDGLEEIASMLVEEVHEGEDLDGPDGLDALMFGLWTEIEGRMVGWAERLETSRATRQEGTAA